MGKSEMMLGWALAQRNLSSVGRTCTGMVATSSSGAIN